jgi:hypothetical protein
MADLLYFCLKLLSLLVFTHSFFLKGNCYTQLKGFSEGIDEIMYYKFHTKRCLNESKQWGVRKIFESCGFLNNKRTFLMCAFYPLPPFYYHLSFSSFTSSSSYFHHSYFLFSLCILFLVLLIFLLLLLFSLLLFMFLLFLFLLILLFSSLSYPPLVLLLLYSLPPYYASS